MARPRRRPGGRPTRRAAGEERGVSPATWVAFVAAGALGAPTRFLVGAAVSARTRSGFPWGTLVVNATGSLALGVLTGLALYHAFPAAPKLVLGTGFCGAYTTFSTF